MTPDDQHVRTRGSARPRNLAAGCLAVLVVLAALWLLGRAVRQSEPGPALDAPAPAAETSVL